MIWDKKVATPGKHSSTGSICGGTTPSLFCLGNHKGCSCSEVRIWTKKFDTVTQVVYRTVPAPFDPTKKQDLKDRLTVAFKLSYHPHNKFLQTQICPKSPSPSSTNQKVEGKHETANFSMVARTIQTMRHPPNIICTKRKPLHKKLNHKTGCLTWQWPTINDWLALSSFFRKPVLRALISKEGSHRQKALQCRKPVRPWGWLKRRQQFVLPTELACNVNPIKFQPLKTDTRHAVSVHVVFSPCTSVKKLLAHVQGSVSLRILRVTYYPIPLSLTGVSMASFWPVQGSANMLLPDGEIHVTTGSHVPAHG